MLKIELQENTFDVEIYENVFTVNADDISNHQAIDYMLKKYRVIEILLMNLLMIVKNV